MYYIPKSFSDKKATRSSDIAVLFDFTENQKYTTEFSPSKIVTSIELYQLGIRRAGEKIARGERCFNAHNLCLSEIRLNPDKTPHFKYRVGDYIAYLGTHDSLDLTLEDGHKVREQYGDIKDMTSLKGYCNSIYAKTIGTSVLVLTSDNKALFTKRSQLVAIEPGSIHVTIAEGMTSHDVDSNGRINPIEAFMRGVKEELHDTKHNLSVLNFDSGHIRLLGLGISKKYLLPEFCLLAEVPHRASEVIKRASDSAEDAWERQDLFAVDFKLDTLEKLFSENPYSPHAYMTVQMALKYKKLI